VNTQRVVVFGAHGFIGSAVVTALRDRNVDVVTMTTPRLPGSDADLAAAAVRANDELVGRLAEGIRGADAVVNASGNPDASESDERCLTAANAVVPGVIAAAVSTAGVPRFVHVSSAVVQGDAAILDESVVTSPFSPYSRSKATGERLALEYAANSCVVYRPASVHAASRRVTQLTAAIARSPLATVAGSDDRPTPQALVGNVADAIAYLATVNRQPPRVVIHPWEGLTTAHLLELLGRKQPRHIATFMARTVVALLRVLGRFRVRMAANARRVEMLWFGQAQAPSWLITQGWTPPEGTDAWRALGVALATREDQHRDRARARRG